MEIHLLRHTPVKDLEGICYGQADVALADDYADSFIKINTDQKYDKVISSPLTRCTNLADYLTFDYQIDERLKEVNFGKWELQKWEHIDKEEFNHWHDDYINIAPPNGESLITMQIRVLALLKELKKNHSQDKILLITHAGVIRIIVSFISKIPLKDIFNIKVGYGELKKLILK